jgi:hypothetical protein
LNGFPYLGSSQYERGGFSDSLQMKGGLYSRKRRYPILSAKEFIGIGKATNMRSLNISQQDIVSSRKLLGVKNSKRKRIGDL